MLGKLAIKNIIYKPLSSALCVCLLLFGVGIISSLLIVQNHIEQKFQRNTKNVDLVLGAKGSPLQLVLSSIYHLDSPVGNISLAEANEIMNHENVEEAIPLAYGDSYNGYRILGTTPNYVEKYEGGVVEGRIFSQSMEAIIGYEVAIKNNLTIGQQFVGTHGEDVGGSVHKDNPYTIVGILGQTNTIIDRLILTDIESVWAVHLPEDGVKGMHDHVHHHLHDDETFAENHDHVHSFDHSHDQFHSHSHDSDGKVITAGSHELTAVLLKCKSNSSALGLQALINQESNMQAIIPNAVVSRLFYMLGMGASTIRFIAIGIMGLAGFSVFFILINRLRERKFELALLRSVGYKPTELFFLLMLEGLSLALIGYILGWILSRVGIFIINGQAQDDFNLKFTLEWVDGEIWVLVSTLLIGCVSALIPAISAMKMDISSLLSKK